MREQADQARQDATNRIQEAGEREAQVTALGAQFGAEREAIAKLRTQAEALPESPGVYLFWGRSAMLPLYIGKSIHLRSRVLSHLRDPDSARWVAQSLRIEHRRTPGEVGALLLEAALVKQLQPLHNQRLRRVRHLHAWRLADGAAQPELVDTTRLGGMAHEELGDPDFKRAPSGIESHVQRISERDSYLIRGRRITAPVVTDPDAAVTMVGAFA